MIKFKNRLKKINKLDINIIQLKKIILTVIAASVVAVFIVIQKQRQKNNRKKIKIIKLLIKIKFLMSLKTKN